MRRIAKEIADVHSDPLSEVEVDAVGNGEDLTHLKGSFKGPPGTQYDGGLYKIDIKIPNEYPFRPPIMKFENKIWHPNISSQTVGFPSPNPPVLLSSPRSHPQLITKANCISRAQSASTPSLQAGRLS